MINPKREVSSYRRHEGVTPAVGSVGGALPATRAQAGPGCDRLLVNSPIALWISRLEESVYVALCLPLLMVFLGTSPMRRILIIGFR